MAEKVERLAQKGRIKSSETTVKQLREQSPLHEQYGMTADVIVISGPSGTGKTSFTEEFHSLLPGVDLFLGGQRFREIDRERRGVDTSVIGFAKRPYSVDDQLDDEQRRRMRTAQERGQQHLIEARLGIVNATEVLDEYDQKGLMAPKIVRVLWTADEDERMRRIVMRSLKEQEENPNLEQLTPEQIIAKTLRRESGDRKQWAKRHPLLRSEEIDTEGKDVVFDPYDKDLRGPDGKPLFYDYVIDTTRMSQLESTVFVISLLETAGCITKLEEEEDRDMVQVFPTPAIA
jgi:cytidylate kinase